MHNIGRNLMARDEIKTSNDGELYLKCGEYCITHLVGMKIIPLGISTFYLEGTELDPRCTIKGSVM